MNALATKTEDLPLAPAPAVAGSPMLAMISDAIQKGHGIEVIRELKTMAKEFAEDEARRAFDAALSAAKSEIKPITKNRRVGFDSKKAGAARTDYRHEDLAEIARSVDPILSKHGLSYRFCTESKPNEPVTVTCILAHRDGHSEQNTLSAGRDDSGNKNSIQAIGSTITYLQRYTLKAALGLSAANDDDGGKADETEDLTEEQIDELSDLIDKAVESRPGTDRAEWLESYLTFMKVDSLNAIRPDQFAKAKITIQNAIAGSK